MNEELDDEFILQLKHDFLAEASDLLFKFDTILLNVNNYQNISLDEIREIFKIIHTLKGNCRAAGFDQFGSFFHLFENLLAQLRDGAIASDRETLSLFFAFLEKSQECVEIYKKNMDEIIDFSALEKLIENFNSNESHISKDAEKASMVYQIAIIDDDASIREIMTCALKEEFSAAISEYADGEIALTEVGKKQFDLIIVDYQMPIMNGKEFLKIIRQPDQINATTPVLFISGLSPEIGTDATMTEDIYYIQKPFNINRVIYYAKCSFLKNKRA